MSWVRNIILKQVFYTSFQLYKAIGDFTQGSEMYKKYSNVDENTLKDRATVLKRKQPRRLFIQCNTDVKGNLICVVIIIVIYEFLSRVTSSNISGLFTKCLLPIYIATWNARPCGNN